MNYLEADPELKHLMKTFNWRGSGSIQPKRRRFGRKGKKRFNNYKSKKKYKFKNCGNTYNINYTDNRVYNYNYHDDHSDHRCYTDNRQYHRDNHSIRSHNESYSYNDDHSYNDYSSYEYSSNRINDYSKRPALNDESGNYGILSGLAFGVGAVLGFLCGGGGSND